jgi:hypothetical protein
MFLLDGPYIVTCKIVGMREYMQGKKGSDSVLMLHD